jgi:small GTP-binding protein
MDFDSHAFLFRVVTIGETAVGKTSLINRLINGKFVENENPTIGGNFLMYNETIQEHRVELQIWDTAGQEKYRSLSPIYCRDASGGILVFDLTNKETFLKLDNWRKIFTDAASQNALLYVVANKADMKDKFQVTIEEAEEWAEENGCPFFRYVC